MTTILITCIITFVILFVQRNSEDATQRCLEMLAFTKNDINSSYGHSLLRHAETKIRSLGYISETQEYQITLLIGTVYMKAESTDLTYALESLDIYLGDLRNAAS